VVTALAAQLVQVDARLAAFKGPHSVTQGTIEAANRSLDRIGDAYRASTEKLHRDFNQGWV
jgi:hypothetical protein